MNYLFCCIFIVLGVISRIIPHAPNFTPILSIALLSGFYIKNRYIVILPILAMLFSDIIIGNHGLVVWVYSSLIFIFILGSFALKDSTIDIITKSMLSSFIFFVLTNFGVWFTGGYSYNYNGLLLCYTMALPFFKNTIISTTLFSLAIFGIYRLINIYVLKIRKISV